MGRHGRKNARNKEERNLKKKLYRRKCRPETEPRMRKDPCRLQGSRQLEFRGGAGLSCGSGGGSHTPVGGAWGGTSCPRYVSGKSELHVLPAACEPDPQ